MPKGIPNNKTTEPDAAATTRSSKRLSITLNPGDYEALCVLAQEQYRTPDLQAAYLIMRVLADAGRSTSIEGRKEKLIGRVAEIRAGNGAQE